MSSSGPNSPGTLADDSGVGFITWSNPGNAGASDNSYATASVMPTGATHYLKATNFGFSIPSDATVDGIVVEVERKESGSSVARDNRVRIVKGGTIGSTDKASGTEWPTSDAYATYGSSSDKWGETWTPSDINASTFGAAISALGLGTGTASIDHIRITVYYTASANITVTPGTASLATNGYAPTIRLDKFAKPASQALVLTGFAPTALLSGAAIVQPAAGVLVITTYAPTIRLDKFVKPFSAALNITGYAPTIRESIVVSPATRPLALSTFAPSIRLPQVVRPASKALALTTYAPSLAVQRKWRIQGLTLHGTRR